jgi:signal peptidase II
MNYKKYFVAQIALATLILLADRITKMLALAYCATERVISPFASCILTFNRGISWGMLHDSCEGVFWAVTVMIACITAYLAYIMIERLRAGDPALGYVCVVAGSVSNLIDRVMYGAVIDFISHSFWGWQSPVFNVADIYIVCGIIWIFISSVLYPSHAQGER